jgi:hypothetical protein
MIESCLNKYHTCGPVYLSICNSIKIGSECWANLPSFLAQFISSYESVQSLGNYVCSSQRVKKILLKCSVKKNGKY